MDRVIFRTWLKEPKNVIAFLPDNQVWSGNIDSYEHNGQHGEANLGIMQRPYTRLATPEEYKELLAELKNRGYKPKVYKRLNRKWLKWVNSK